MAGTWTELSVAGEGPAPRDAHTWTVDPVGRVAYLFGGRDGSAVFGDLWRFDLATERWERLAPSGKTPPARFGHDAVWFSEGGFTGMVIFAGQSSGGFFNDLWRYDPATNGWSVLPAGGDPPIPRYGSCAALGQDGRLFVSHGFTEERVRFADTRAYDFAAHAWTDVTPGGDVPVARCLHSCFIADDGSFVLYAGQTTGVPALGDLWALGSPGGGGASAWREVKEPLPPPRNLYAGARVGGAIVVFGGGSLDQGYLADTWVLSAADLKASMLSTSGGTPAARSAAAFVADPASGRLLLFGGRNASLAFADLWSLALR